MMHVEITPSHADFVGPNGLAGRYHYRGPFKPFVHPVHTPKGHGVTVASPHDHVHHRGMMYALRTFEVNFWEERSTKDDEGVGVQQHLGFDDAVTPAEEAGFTQRLRWVDSRDDAGVFDEARRITCRVAEGGRGYEWRWEADLTSRRPQRLIKSQWSSQLGNGKVVNYHGLGIRMRREFGGRTGGYALDLDGQRYGENILNEAGGATPKVAKYTGSFDGVWPVERASVSIAQDHGHGLSIYSSPFAFMALGPSNLEEIDLAEGQVLHERYRVTVADEARA